MDLKALRALELVWAASQPKALRLIGLIQSSTSVTNVSGWLHKACNEFLQSSASASDSASSSWKDQTDRDDSWKRSGDAGSWQTDAWKDKSDWWESSGWDEPKPKKQRRG